MSIPAIEIKDLQVTFRDKVVLENINISIPQGEFLGLIGPNGAGKSVLLKTILGLIKPNHGQINILGKPPKLARGLISYVPQYANFNSSFPINVIDVTLMGRLGLKNCFKRYYRGDYKCAFRALEKVDLKHMARTGISKLSGGQLQRVLIARALAVEPKILLLDEPTANIDSRIGGNVYQLLEELSPDVTVILVSHDVGVISSYIDSIACLNKTLHYHHSKEINSQILEEVYGCPMELLSHGHPHRVLESHPKKK